MLVELTLVFQENEVLMYHLVAVLLYNTHTLVQEKHCDHGLKLHT